MPTPAYSRPVINLTVPIQTVMGIGDDPGVLADGTVIPAGQMVELTSTSYKPTAPIWRHVVAEWGSCFEPACKRGRTAKHAPGFSLEQHETRRGPRARVGARLPPRPARPLTASARARSVVTDAERPGGPAAATVTEG